MKKSDENALSVLIVSHSFYLSTQIYNMVNWEEHALHVLVERNACSCVSLLSELNPDILICFEASDWVGIDAILNALKNRSVPTQIIMIAMDEGKENESFYGHNIQWIQSNELNEEKLLFEIERARSNIIISSGQRDEFHEKNGTEDFISFVNALEKIEKTRLIIFRMVFEKVRDREELDNTIKNVFLEKPDESYDVEWILEGSGNCCFLFGLSELNMERQLDLIEKRIVGLKNVIQHESKGGVSVFASSVVTPASSRNKYMYLKQFENKRFFLGEFAIITDKVLEEENVDVSADWNIDDKYIKDLIEEVIDCNVVEQARILRKTFMDYAKPSKNITYSNMIINELEAILERILQATRQKSAEEYFRQNEKREFWTIEEMLEYELHRFEEASEILRDVMMPLNPIVKKTLVYLMQSLEKPLYVNEIADEIKVSESYLSKLFKKQTGCGITETLRHIRIKASVKDIQNGESHIWRLAEKYGFSDPKYFSKVFKMETGKSPSDYIEAVNESKRDKTEASE